MQISDLYHQTGFKKLSQAIYESSNQNAGIIHNQALTHGQTKLINPQLTAHLQSLRVIDLKSPRVVMLTIRQ